MDTIKRVQDLMQVRDMNLCVLAKKCGISYSTIQTTHIDSYHALASNLNTLDRIHENPSHLFSSKLFQLKSLLLEI